MPPETLDRTTAIRKPSPTGSVVVGRQLAEPCAREGMLDNTEAKIVAVGRHG